MRFLKTLDGSALPLASYNGFAAPSGKRRRAVWRRGVGWVALAVFVGAALGFTGASVGRRPSGTKDLPTAVYALAETRAQFARDRARGLTGAPPSSIATPDPAPLVAQEAPPPRPASLGSKRSAAEAWRPQASGREAKSIRLARVDRPSTSARSPGRAACRQGRGARGKGCDDAGAFSRRLDEAFARAFPTSALESEELLPPH